MTTRPSDGHPTRPDPAPTHTRSYGSAEEQVYDVYLPASRAMDPDPAMDPAQVAAWLVLIHGGFWRQEWDRAHLRPLAAALAEAGYGVALLEYARTGMARGGFPGTFHDVAAGLAAVRAAEVDGGVPVVLVGHSAGGQLAAWLLRQHEARKVAGTISLAGCLDLGLVAELDLDEGAASDLLGGRPEDVPDRYGVSDPARLGPTPYPMVVVHGTDDERVPLQVARSWWERAATPGRDRLVVLDGLGHFDLINPDHPFFPELLAQVRALLEVS